MKARSTKTQKIAWLIEHQDLWIGYPRPGRPHHLRHHDIIFRAMKKAGLYAPQVVAAEADLADLINTARRLRRAAYAQAA